MSKSDKDWNMIISSLVDNQFYAGFDFISNELAMGLYENAKNAVMSPAKIGKDATIALNPEIRSDQTLWLEEKSNDFCEKEYFSKLQEFMTLVNRELFLGLKSFEVHYAHYSKGSFYKKHIDVHQKSNRKLTFITYLNPDWKKNDGGELIVHSKKILVEPELGQSVFFLSSEIEHEVKISNSDRYSITGWLRTDL